MALWPNGRHMTRSTYKGYGVAPGLNANLKNKGDRLNRFVSASFARTASTPDGYDMKGAVPAIRAGSMSALRTIATLRDGPSNLLQGGPMEGTGVVAELTGGGNVSLVVGMAGTAAVATLSGNNLELKLTIGLDGTGSISLTGAGCNLALIVPFAGSGSVAQFAGASDLRGRLSLAGEWTPFTELSPQGLAAAVWNSALAQHQADGTAGRALATASSGGVDLNLLAAAVWGYVSRTLTDSAAGATPEAIAAEVLAVLNAATIPVDVRKMVGTPMGGSGVAGDEWGPVAP